MKRVATIAPVSARPTEPPIWRIELITPDPTPALSTGTEDIATEVIGVIVIPMPIPPRIIAGRSVQKVECTPTRLPELDLARQTMFEARIGLIDEALRRLERGAYGRCVVCGKEIPAERLDLVPETPFCIEDAEREQQSSTR